MKGAAKKKITDKINPNIIEKENIDETSSSVSALCCTIAGLIPKLLNKLKKEIKTEMIATIPNSLGVNKRASVAPITILITMLLYLERAV